MLRRITSMIVVAAALVAAAAFLIVTIYSAGMLARASLVGGDGDWSGIWWRSLLSYRYLLATPLTHSLLLGLGTALAASAMGAAIAWFATRSDLPGRGAILAFAALPHIIPGFQLASAWVLLFMHNGLWSSFFGTAAPLPAYGGVAAWLVMSLHLYVFSFAVIAAAMSSLDASLEEAGRAVGLSPLGVMRKVTLPLVIPAIASGALLCFAYAVEEFGVPSLLGAPAGFSTLTTAVYEQVTTPPLSFGAASAQSVILALVAIVVLSIGLRLGKNKVATISGKGARPNRVALGVWRWPLAVTIWTFLLATSLLPLASLALTSFLKSWGRGYGPANWTLDRHLALVSSPDLLHAIANTIFLAGGAALLAMLVGIVVAYGAVRLRSRLAKLVDGLSFVAFATPGIVIGVALMLAFGRGVLNLYGTYAILIVAYMVRFSGVSVRTITTSFLQLGNDPEDAGRAVGLPFLQRVMRVAIPLARPAIIAGLLLAFINGVKEISCTSLLVSQGHQTLAYEAYIRFQEGNYTQGSAISLWMIFLCVVVMALVMRLNRGASQELTT